MGYLVQLQMLTDGTIELHAKKSTVSEMSEYPVLKPVYIWQLRGG